MFIFGDKGGYEVFAANNYKHTGVAKSIMNFLQTNRKSLGVAIVLAMSSSIVVANESDYALEEIVVTAQKRSQNLQDVPLSVSAFGGDFVEQSGSANLVDLAAYTPGFTATNSSRGFGTIAMRGVSSNDFGIGGDPSVGVYIDGVYIGRGGSAVTDFDDIASIEILKGPQGTLFGRNTAGGAISITSNPPTNERELNLGVSVGRFNYREVRGTFNLPLIDDTLTMRGSVKSKQQDGWMDNVIFNDHAGEIDTTSGRLAFLWTPTDSVSVTFSSDWERTDDEAMVANDLIAMDPSVITNGFVTGIFDNVNALNAALGADVFHQDTFDSKDYKYASNVPAGSFDRKQRGHSLNIEWDIADSLTLTSLTAYREFQMDYSEDIDGTELDIFQIPSSYQTQETYSQEFRLSGYTGNVDWFVGVSAFKENITTTDVNDFPFVGLTDITYGAKAKTESYALFSDMIWKLSENVNLTTGIRYSYDAKTHEILGDTTPLGEGGAADLNYIFGGGVLPAFEDSQHENWENVSPRVVLDYAVSDDIMVYGSYTMGYKSGGFNSGATSYEEPPFGPENVESYELGLKSTWMDNRLKWNLALFHFSYEDLQVLTRDGLSLVIENAGKASASGVETDISFLVTERLNLTASAGFLDAEYDEFDDAGIDRSGQDLVRSPHFSGSLGVDYEVSLAEAGSLRFYANYSYTGEQIYSHTLNSLGKEDAYGLINARMTYYSPDSSISVSIFGENLTDEHYFTSRGNSGYGLGFYNAKRGMPLTWGASLDYKFN